MSKADDLLQEVCQAFARVPRPERFTAGSLNAELDWHDDEVDSAEAVFRSRTPQTLCFSDVGIGAGWPEVFLTPNATKYYMPGFVRLILSPAATAGFEVSDFLNILSPDQIANFDQTQKTAIVNVLDFIREPLDDHTKEIIDRRLKRLRA